MNELKAALRNGPATAGMRNTHRSGRLLIREEPPAGPAAGTGDLLRAARAGDSAAWEEIVRSYGGLMWATARSFRLQPADAGDAVQLTWLRLIENCVRIDNPERLGGWLKTTAHRECLRISRRDTHLAHGAEGPGDSADPADDLEERVIDAVTAQEIRALVKELPPRWRTLLHALYTDAPRTYSEITDTLGIPIGSIGPTRTRALKQLRCMIEERGLDLAGVS
ncbi:sigma-70 family RNA polymerase sigma factor [Amycolatopsis sp. NBC_01307]|uniref:RNA polymerase sigma factor n=1 Tax=Amycolatopsis sp. NBC_01307 TaxID=2903561 RepID=UPI002E137441|nr:sigma-70 family RNA polymerase sigma factor [Amycolatopsis sp. NBC_01307]